MKYLKKYEHIHSYGKIIPFNFEYNENDYVLININDMTTKPDLPFAKIIEIPFLNYNTTDTITVEMIMNNNIITSGLFTEDVVRYLKKDEIKKYKLRKKAIKYNL